MNPRCPFVLLLVAMTVEAYNNEETMTLDHYKKNQNLKSGIMICTKNKTVEKDDDVQKGLKVPEPLDGVIRKMVTKNKRGKVVKHEYEVDIKMCGPQLRAYDRLKNKNGNSTIPPNECCPEIKEERPICRMCGFGECTGECRFYRSMEFMEHVETLNLKGYFFPDPVAPKVTLKIKPSEFHRMKDRKKYEIKEMLV